MESGLKLGILASGLLGFHVLETLIGAFEIVFIATNTNSNEIKTLSNHHKVPLFVGNPRKGQLFSFVRDKKCDVILSINYLYLIENDIISFPKKFAINFHGSLLPKFRGRTPHVWAIINGEKECGITAHLIDEECDTGDILFQQRVTIGTEDTGQEILEKYNLYYPTIVQKVLSMIKWNKIKPLQQKHEKATFYGKRTPNDGQIDWDWQKDRIHNWVRAQAYPYPGAFTFYNGAKLIVDQVDFSDLGYDFSTENGTIVSVIENTPFVKTPNGVLRLSIIRNQTDLKFSENKILK